MEKTKVTSWAFLKEMFGPEEKIGIMAYEAKDQVHKATVKATQIVKTCGEALSPEFTKRLQYLNARGLNIVVGVNPLKDDAKTRSKDSVKEIRHLIADIDSRTDDVTGRMVSGKERLDAMLADVACPKPYFILNTSPENYQAVWRVSDFSREQAESTQRALGAYYGGDRNISTDISRGVRLPGLHNKKYDETFPVKCDYGAKIVHRPESFSYLPEPEAITRKSSVSPVAPELAASKPPIDLPDRTRRDATTVSQAYSNTGKDGSGSGRDWAHCNHEIAVALRKQGISQFEPILQSLRPYLEESARSRKKGNPRYYAEFTIKSLRNSWQGRLHEFAFEPQRQAAATNGNSASTVVPHVKLPAPRPGAELPNTTQFPTSGKSQEVPAPVGSVPAAQAVPGLYIPTPEQRKHDSFCVRQDLVDGNAPKQIYDNMLEWRMKDVPGAEVYLTNLILEQQRILRAESLVPTLQVTLQQSTNELDVYRQLLNMQVPGEGVLLTAVTALDRLSKDQWSNGALDLAAQVGSPATNEATRDQAFRLATLAFTHGDSVSGVEQALAAKYHPNLALETTPPYLSQLAQQAQAAQALALTNQEREHIR